MSAAAVVRRARPFVWVAAAVGLVAIIVWQVGAWSPTPEATAENTAFGDSAEPGVDIYPPGERSDAPVLEGTTLDGDPLALSDWAGDIVVINTLDTKLVDSAVYAFNYEGEAVVKRLARDAGQWWLTSDNVDGRKYHRKLCQGGECIVIGRVVRKESDRI